MFQIKYPQITEVFNKKMEKEPRISRLGMSISKSEGGNVIEEFGALPKRAISRSANGYLYSFLLDVSSHN